MTVFISYSSQDFHEPRLEGTSVPGKIKEAIEKAVGIFTFFDRSSIRTGDHWRDSISRGLSQSQALIVLAGPKFFDAEQFERLGNTDSVLRHELLTAQRLKTRLILPVFYGTDPPHRTGRRWPKDLEWLQDLQWTEIRVDQVESNVNEIVREVCELFAQDLMRNARNPADLVHLIIEMSKATVHVRRSFLHLLSTPGINPLTSISEHDLEKLRNSSKIIHQILAGQFEDDFDNAINGQGTFYRVPLPLRAIFILCSIRASGSLIPQASLTQFDHLFRAFLTDHGANSHAKSHKKHISEIQNEHLNRFLLIAIQRIRERQWSQNLEAPANLLNLYESIKNLPIASQKNLSRCFEILIASGLYLHKEDLLGYLGKAKLKPVAKVIRSNHLRKGNTNNRSKRSKSQPNPSSQTSPRRKPPKKRA